MKNLITLSSLLFFLSLFGAPELTAQQLMVDRGIRVAGLWCFPVHGDSLSYHYLPARGRLGMTPDSLPEFSFMRYVTEKPSAGSTATVTEAGGGGIVNFLVLYDTPAAQIERARTEIKRLLDNDDAVLKGPVAFAEGRYTLVSSILRPDGEKEQEVLATGTAPVLENSRVAFSFDLDPLRSKLMLENFQMKTPDISVVFELGFSGLTENYEAEVTVNWDEVRKHKSYNAGVSVYYVSADVEAAFDEMRSNKAIDLKTFGDDEHLDGLLTTVYDKLLELLFRKVEPEKLPEKAQGGIMDALLGGGMDSRKMTGFGVSVGFRYKELKASGKATLNFRGSSSVQRKHFITFNIGDLWRRYGQRKDIFRDVALYDPAFQQREVYVNLDGALTNDFSEMVNSVTVRLEKQHGSGEMTVKEVMVTRENFRDSTNRFRMVYLNDQDSSMTDWLHYAYQTVWQFSGGGSYTTPWDTTDAAMINLYAPFQRRQIALEGDLSALKEQGFKAVSIKINYPFFDQQRQDSRLLRPGDDPSTIPFEVTLPRGREAIDYQIVLMKPSGPPKRWKGLDEFGLIFFDEPPENQEP